MLPNQKTTLLKMDAAQKDWVVVDLDGQTLGRAATVIANALRGKNKVNFTPHADMGSYVIAINSAKVKLTGKKWQDKKYYSHSGYRGGIKEFSAEKLMARHPEDLIRKAVHGMLPDNRMTKHLMRNLRIFADANHPHQAQSPNQLSLTN